MYSDAQLTQIFLYFLNNLWERYNNFCNDQWPMTNKSTTYNVAKISVFIIYCYAESHYHLHDDVVNFQKLEWIASTRYYTCMSQLRCPCGPRGYIYRTSRIILYSSCNGPQQTRSFCSYCSVNETHILNIISIDKVGSGNICNSRWLVVAFVLQLLGGIRYQPCKPRLQDPPRRSASPDLPFRRQCMSTGMYITEVNITFADRYVCVGRLAGESA